MAAIAITTPVTRQIIQRLTAATGSIAATGTTTAVADGQHVQAQFNGSGTWTRIATVASNAWSGTLTSQFAGQGTFQVRVEEDTPTTASVSIVGLGDLFATGGQSNMDGAGDNGQVYSNANGLHASIYKASAWGDLTEIAGSGSFRPLLATQIMARTGVPVGYVFASAGGTNISQWLPSDAGNLYNADIKAPCQATNPGLFLWWQGESDAIGGTSQVSYHADMATIVAAVAADLGSIKTMACLLQTMDTGTASAPNQATIRAAKVQSFGDGGNNLTGPDLSGVSVGLHVTSDADLLIVATDWYNALFAAGYLPQSTTTGISRTRMQLCM